MLSREGRQYMEIAPRLALWPGLCLTVTVYALNLFGDAVRDLLDPRLRRAAADTPACWRWAEAVYHFERFLAATGTAVGGRSPPPRASLLIQSLRWRTVERRVYW